MAGDDEVGLGVVGGASEVAPVVAPLSVELPLELPPLPELQLTAAGPSTATAIVPRPRSARNIRRPTRAMRIPLTLIG